MKKLLALFSLLVVFILAAIASISEIGRAHV